jgi:hypothetical protein
MKTITLELPDEAAKNFEALPRDRRTKAALLVALLAQSKPKSLSEIFKSADKKVMESGLSESEIDSLLDELS